MSLRLGYPQNAASIHQGLEILCHGRKGGRFFHGVKGFHIEFPELSILCGGINYLHDKHLWSTYYVLCGAQGRQRAHRWSRKQPKNLRKHEGQEALPIGGWRSQVKLSGKSRTTPPCSSNYLRLGCISQAFKGKKIKFSFPKLALFQFYQLPWLQ